MFIIKEEGSPKGTFTVYPTKNKGTFHRDYTPSLLVSQGINKVSLGARVINEGTGRRNYVMYNDLDAHSLKELIDVLQKVYNELEK